MMRSCRYCGRILPETDFKVDGYGRRGRRCRDCRRDGDRAARERYVAANPERERNRLLRAAQTPKAQAREKVRKAVADGRLIRSATCERCGVETRTNGHHHKGYADPLVVEWLCRTCHNDAHRVSNEAEVAVLRGALTTILALVEGEAPLLDHYRREIERVARAALQSTPETRDE